MAISSIKVDLGTSDKILCDSSSNKDFADILHYDSGIEHQLQASYS